MPKYKAIGVTPEAHAEADRIAKQRGCPKSIVVSEMILGIAKGPQDWDVRNAVRRALLGAADDADLVAYLADCLTYEEADEEADEEEEAEEVEEEGE